MKTKYRVGDKVVCLMETRANGYKYLLAHNPNPTLPLEDCTTQVVAIDTTCEEQTVYTVLVPDEASGWVVSKFHVAHLNIAAVFIGKKFWEIPEPFIIRKA